MFSSKVVRLFTCLLVFVSCVIVMSGCDGGDKPEVRRAEFIPMYVCTGETSTFYWETKNVDKIKIFDSGGRELVSDSRSSGSCPIPALDKDMLPFTCKGYVGDESREYSLGELLVLEDMPQWLTFNAPEKHYVEGHDSYVIIVNPEYDEPTWFEDIQVGLDQYDRPIYERVEFETIYETITKYIWDLSIYFADESRARAINVSNPNEKELSISAGSFGPKKVRRNEVIEITPVLRPGISWSGELTTGLRVKVGKHQKGKGKEGCRYDSDPDIPIYKLNLEVICMEN